MIRVTHPQINQINTAPVDETTNVLYLVYITLICMSIYGVLCFIYKGRHFTLQWAALFASCSAFVRAK